MCQVLEKERFWILKVALSRVKPFPQILRRSFVSTITSGEAYIYAGIFGFAKGSNFLKFLIDTVKASYLNIKDYKGLWIPVKGGPIFFTAMFVSYDFKIKSSPNPKFQP